MPQGKRAFETLETDNQKAMIDIASALAVIVTRLPRSEGFTPALVAEYAKQTGVSLNVANYAMQDIWHSLLDQDWQFIVTKRENELTTQFIPTRTGDGGNGEQTPDRPRIIAP